MAAIIPEFGKRYIRTKGPAGWPKEAYVVSKEPDDTLVRICATFPGDATGRFVHRDKFIKYYTPTKDAAIQAELFPEEQLSKIDKLKAKHIKL